jgi:DNA-binding NarL/FixJ family response regulator
MKMLTAAVLTTDKFFEDTASYFLGQRGYHVLPATPADEASPLRPDLCIVHSGPAATAVAQQALDLASPTGRLVVYEAACPAAGFPQLARLGATGCLTAADGLAELLACLDGLPRGERYLSASATRCLQAPAPAPTPASPWAKLSTQERNVLTLIGQGLGSKQIAETLFVSSHTIKNHKTNISRKLEVGSCRDLLSIALSATTQMGKLVTYSY